MKKVADVLTASRFAAALTLIGIGLAWGARALIPAVILSLVAWSTDSIDGALARKDPNWHPTWIGEQDVLFDAALALGILAYFVLSGLFPARIALLWLGAWGVLFLLTRARAVLLLALGGMDGMVLWSTFRANRDLGWIVVGWMVIVAFLDRRRFRQVLAIFFGSAAHVLGLADSEPEEVRQQKSANHEVR